MASFTNGSGIGTKPASAKMVATRPIKEQMRKDCSATVLCRYDTALCIATSLGEMDVSTMALFRLISTNMSEYITTSASNTQMELEKQYQLVTGGTPGLRDIWKRKVDQTEL